MRSVVVQNPVKGIVGSVKVKQHLATLTLIQLFRGRHVVELVQPGNNKKLTESQRLQRVRIPAKNKFVSIVLEYTSPLLDTKYSYLCVI